MEARGETVHSRNWFWFVVMTWLVLPAPALAGGTGPAHRLASRAAFLCETTAKVWESGAGISLEGWGYGVVGGRVGFQVGYLAFPGAMPEGTEAADRVAGVFSLGAVVRWNEIPAVKTSWNLPLELRTSLDSRVLAAEPLVGVGVDLGVGLLWAVTKSLGLQVELWGGWMQILTHSTDVEPDSGPMVGVNLEVSYLWR